MIESNKRHLQLAETQMRFWAECRRITMEQLEREKSQTQISLWSIRHQELSRRQEVLEKELDSIDDPHAGIEELPYTE